MIKQVQSANQAELRDIRDATGVPLPTLAKIKFRQTKDPRVSTIESIAAYFTAKAGK